MLECKLSSTAIFLIQVKIKGHSSPSGFIIELIRDLWVKHILAKSGADSSMFACDRVEMKSIIVVFVIQG